MRDFVKPDPSPQLQTLLEDPANYGFFEVVRFLCELHPDAPMPGGKGPYAQEVVRFIQDASMAFPPGDIRDIQKKVYGSREKYEVQATFLGLSGAGTPLPLSLITDLGIEGEEFETDRAYLDMIHHRLYGLLFQAQHRLEGIRSLGAAGEKVDDHAPLELVGPALRRGGVSLRYLSSEDLMGLAPALVQGQASLEMLELSLARVLREVIGADSEIEVVPMTGTWVALEPEERWCLGRDGCALGQETVLGQEAWVRSLGATICIRKLPWERYHAGWVQAQHACGKMREMIGLLLSEPIEWALEFEIVDLPAPGWLLGEHALGASSWLMGPQCETLTAHRLLPSLEELQVAQRQGIRQ